MASLDDMVEETQADQHPTSVQHNYPQGSIDKSRGHAVSEAAPGVNVSNTIQKLKKATENGHETVMNLEFKRHCLLKESEKLHHFTAKYAEVESAMDECKKNIVAQKDNLQKAKAAFDLAQQAFLDAKRQHTESSVMVFLYQAELDDIQREISSCKDRMQQQTEEVRCFLTPVDDSSRPK